RLARRQRLARRVGRDDPPPLPGAARDRAARESGLRGRQQRRHTGGARGGRRRGPPAEQRHVRRARLPGGAPRRDGLEPRLRGGEQRRASHRPSPHARPPPHGGELLGARNLVRLLRTYATEEQRRHFIVLCRKELPLEFMGVVMGREGWMTLGRWNWQEFRDWYFIRRHAVLRRRPVGFLGKAMRAVA